MEYQLVAFDEGRFIVSSSVDQSQANEAQTIDVSINPILRYRDNSSLVGTTLAITIGDEKNPLLNYAFTLTFWIDGFEEFLKSSPSDQEILDHTKDLWPEAIGFARGAMAARCSGTPLKHVFLPNIPITDFFPNVTLKKESMPSK